MLKVYKRFNVGKSGFCERVVASLNSILSGVRVMLIFFSVAFYLELKSDVNHGTGLM